MNKFLMTEAFADFLLVEAVVITSVTYTIDGHVRKDFYTKQEQEERKFPPFAEWETLRPQVLQMIKGKRTPLLMKLLLACKPEKADVLLADKRKEEETVPAGMKESADLSGTDEPSGTGFIKNLLCTVKYENGFITLTGGVSYQGFTMDKNPEKQWDQELCRLLDKMELEYEIM